MAQSGAGADITRIAESAQCLFAAVRFYLNKNRDLKPEHISESVLKQSMKYVDVDDRNIVKNIFSKMDSTWFNSLCITANKMYKLVGNKSASKGYIFHRGSKWVDSFESQYKVWNVESGRVFSNLNKYTPADIWIISKTGSKKKWKDCPNFGESNKYLLESYKSGDVIGVSLKKTSVGSVSFYNMPQSTQYKFKYTASVLSRNDFFSSKDVYLEYNKGKIQFRSFSSRPQGWQGEIKGAEANLGKVSGGPLNKIIIDTFPRKSSNIISISDSDAIADEVRDPKNLSESFIKDFYYYYKQVAKVNRLTESEIAVGLRNKEATWIYSKYLGMELLTLFEDLSSTEKDKLITSILLYAMSSSKMSAPFVKIG